MMNLTHAHAHNMMEPIQEGSMPKQTFEKPKCPTCKSGQIQFRKTDMTRWCRVCGESWPVKIRATKPTVKA